MNTSIASLRDYEIVVIDIGNYLTDVHRQLNLLPEGSSIPEDRVLVNMALDVAKSRQSPNVAALKAKCNDIFSMADDALIDTIFTSLFTMALTMIETFNHLQLWSDNGYAMYKLDSFVSTEAIALKKIYNFEQF